MVKRSKQRGNAPEGAVAGDSELPQEEGYRTRIVLMSEAV